MFIGRSRFVILVQIGNSTWLPGPIMCSDWLNLRKSSCQKLLSQWNCNIIEMMTGWSSTKFVIFVPIAYPRWPSQGNNSLPLHTCEPFGGSIFLPILRAPSVPPVNFQNLPPVKKIQYNKILIYILRSMFLEIPHLELPRWWKMPRDTNGKGECHI